MTKSLSSSYVLPPVKRAGRRLGRIAIGTVLAIAAIPAYFYVKGRLTPQHEVILENGNAFAVTIEVAGQRVALPPHQHAVVAAHDGALTVHATGPGGFDETASLELPSTGGFFAAGRAALYNANGATDLAVVSMSYGMPTAPTDAPIHVLPRTGPRLVLLPPGAWGAIDDPFPAQVTSDRATVVITHVCHVDAAAHTLGCANA